MIGTERHLDVVLKETPLMIPNYYLHKKTTVNCQWK